MNHDDHVHLLRGGVPSAGGLWADFGSGTGAFTLALAELVGTDGHITSVDSDAGALREQARALRSRFPQVAVQTLVADFTRPLELPLLDGIVMANALHFQRDKDRVVQLVKNYLRPNGRFVLIEYNVDVGNVWVPYPLSYATWESMARRNGFAHTQRLATVPSRFLKEIYSALSW